jgi:uncharacterized protein
MRAWVSRHPVVVFVVLAYGISWALWAPLIARGALVTPGGSVSHFPGFLGPIVAAFVVTALVDGTAGVRSLVGRMVLVSRPLRRFAVYAFSAAGFLGLALVATALAGGAPAAADFGRFSGLPMLPLPLLVLIVLAANGFGEETGWRGFALPRLQRRFGPLAGTIALAAIWAGWHVPSFWIIEGYRSMGPAMLAGGFGFGILCGSIVLARVANRTAGSVLAVSLWHLCYNFGAATQAARGLIGMVTTSCVMVWAMVLVFRELRRGSRPSFLAVEPAVAEG